MFSKCFLGSVAVHFSEQHFLDTSVNNSIVIKLGEPRFEPGTAGWEVQTVPLSFCTLRSCNSQCENLISSRVKSRSLQENALSVLDTDICTLLWSGVKFVKLHKIALKNVLWNVFCKFRNVWPPNSGGLTPMWISMSTVADKDTLVKIFSSAFSFEIYPMRFGNYSI